MKIGTIIKFLPLIMIFLGTKPLYSQHEEDHRNAGEKVRHAGNKEHYSNVIAFYSGSTLVPTQLHGDKKKDYLFVPTYGLDYARFLKTWLGVGIHNEFELQNYVLVNDEGEEIDRSYIYVGSILVYVLPIKHLAIMFGPGQELSTEHRFNMFKIGVEYALYRGDGNGWYIAPEASMDWVSLGYQTITFGLAVGKGF